MDYARPVSLEVLVLNDEVQLTALSLDLTVTDSANFTTLENTAAIDTESCFVNDTVFPARLRVRQGQSTFFATIELYNSSGWFHRCQSLNCVIYQF